MKRILILKIFILSCTSASSQGLKIDASYEYLYAYQWDKVIQTYNFSRPFEKEKQPLLSNGINTSISYIFKNEKQIKHGLNFAYSFFQSAAENENFNNNLNLHFINLGYFIHYENTEKWKGFYSDLIFSGTSSIMLRNVNGEPYVYDNINAKAFGIGGTVRLKLGYSSAWKNNRCFSPFIAFAYTPYLYAPNNERIINQTKGLTSNNWTAIGMVQIGLTFHIRKQEQ
jgi:hypothetical protein